MVIVKDKSYLITIKVNIGKFFNLPEADAFVTLREPDTITLTKMNEAKNIEGGSGRAFIEFFSGVLPGIIVDHNLYKNDSEKLSTEDVRDLVCDKMDIFVHLVDEYAQKVLFTLGKKSEGN